MLAMAIGLGFGIGEAWYVAWRLYQTHSQAARLPFYMLSGFMGERILAMVLHSIFVSLPVSAIVLNRGRFAQSLVAAMGLHCITDLGPMLFQTRTISIGPTLVLLVLTVVPIVNRSVKHLGPLLGRSRGVFKEGTILYQRNDREN